MGAVEAFMANLHRVPDEPSIELPQVALAYDRAATSARHRLR
ncbi:hypothetical protein [Nocardia jiangxiensis]|uniref:Uncharacterized protein n=1 Tax=Nocardia jiangxiensis TaxID=282685 RepID=A0ABW6SEV1_9NOCA|nr:hypothetical protein [Nocardia jiangxiensis]